MISTLHALIFTFIPLGGCVFFVVVVTVACFQKLNDTYLFWLLNKGDVFLLLFFEQNAVLVSLVIESGKKKLY
jgi:hypothetical protein